MPQSVQQAGKYEVQAGEFHGPAGTYRLLSDEHCFAMHPDAPVPTLLHQSYEAHLEKWMSPLANAADEVATVARVRDAVIKLADSRLLDEPDSITFSTVTTTESTPQGMAVIGRCVILQPARN